MSEKTFDVTFPVEGKFLPWDHSYALFAALSRIQPLVHEDGWDLGVFPINGRRCSRNRTLRLTRQSQLRLRVSARFLPSLMSFPGAVLELDGHQIRLGNPQVRPLLISPRLFSPWVTIKGATESGCFLERVGEELEGRGVVGTYGLVPPRRRASRDGGRGARGPFVRRTRAIKGHDIVGFGLLVEELSGVDSLLLMTQGVGGRRHFGGGLFLPPPAEPR